MHQSTFIPPKPACKRQPSLPAFPLPSGFNNSYEFLEQQVRVCATHIFGSEVSPDVTARLDYELAIIKERGYADYFLIVADLIRAARDRYNIFIGPGRSSAAGSLVSYCLGITLVNPLEHGLLFERFINLNRNILLDIDIECEEGKRNVLTDYLKEKYGEEHVTHIITYEESPEWMFQCGIHACGLALSKEPISHYSPVASVNGIPVTLYDGSSIEDAGPVKLDILGSNALRQIHDIISAINKNRQHTLDISSIPINDAETLKAFNMGQTEGIFMFDSNHLKEILRQCKSLSFNDLVALYTMYRPGPIDFIPEYLERKNGEKSIGYILPRMEKYLKETYGIMIYQEQIMLLAQEIAGFSRGESDEFRKFVGKKKMDSLAIFNQKFIEGGSNNGYPLKKLEMILDNWYKNGIYLFNKSHAVCYTLIAYQMMYLKIHYSDEFNNI